MKPYYDMLNDILEQGEDRGDRTGVGTRSIFGYQARYRDIGKQFPLDTTREINFRQIVAELLWMLRGDTNIQELVKQGCNLWSDWPLKNYNQCNPDAQLLRVEFNEKIRTDDAFAAQWGDCGPVYGHQWRHWETPPEQMGDYGSHIDQIANLVADLKKNPLSRRHIVSAWNVADIPEMIPSGLPPCHVMFQFYCSQLTFEQRCIEAEKVAVRKDDMRNDHDWEDRMNDNNIPKYKLHCQLYIRSNDMALGHPYNVAAYSLLTMMLAQQCNMVTGDFICTIGDAHIYSNHIEKIQHQLARKPRPAPTVKIRKAKDIFSYTIDDFELIDYDPHPAIRYPIAV